MYKVFQKKPHILLHMINFAVELIFLHQSLAKITVYQSTQNIRKCIKDYLLSSWKWLHVSIDVIYLQIWHNRDCFFFFFFFFAFLQKNIPDFIQLSNSPLKSEFCALFNLGSSSEVGVSSEDQTLQPYETSHEQLLAHYQPRTNQSCYCPVV